MIQTSLSDPQVPRTGTIRETLSWEGTSPGITTHNFYLISFYGIGTTEAEILSNVVAYNYKISQIFGPGQSKQDNIDTFIPEESPLGTFSCATIIADDFDGATIYGIYDSKVDINVLTITPGLSATIIGTSFSSI